MGHSRSMQRQAGAEMVSPRSPLHLSCEWSDGRHVLLEMIPVMSTAPNGLFNGRI